MWDTMTESHTIRMGERGRVVIPADIRGRLGLTMGDSLLLTERDGEIRIQPLKQRIRSLQAKYADVAPGRSLADELIAERRAEADVE